LPLLHHYAFNIAAIVTAYLIMPPFKLLPFSNNLYSPDILAAQQQKPGTMTRMLLP